MQYPSTAKDKPRATDALRYVCTVYALLRGVKRDKNTKNIKFDRRKQSADIFIVFFSQTKRGIIFFYCD